MTCIVGFIQGGELWLGGDDGAYGDNEAEVRKHPKVFTKGSMLIGACGSLRIPQIVQYIMHQPAHPKTMGTMKYLVSTWVPALRKSLVEANFLTKETGEDMLPESGLLLGYRGGLFTVEADGNIGELVVPYNSIGSGASHAMAALSQQERLEDGRHPEVRVRDALAIAAAHVNNVAPPFTIISTVEQE